MSQSDSSTTVTPVAAAASTAEGAARPEGTWTERFRLEDKVFESTLHLTPGGRAFILAGPAPGGGGAGTWTATAEGGFSYRIAERLVAEDGTFIGWVDIDHHADLRGDTFTSRGISTVYDADDKVTASVPVEAEATRNPSPSANP
ncbi:hypothetical protein [Streptomyces candidus]|uniref:Uncharacterized protein n=1 Tax=Streptomyces candidus TaxID=67283 RepID=A0A7X0LQ61_9ACTN|nr:hypothetical protein [Streptomyces candidus]MBB6436695.1 hypothetical protein [Streptomyces candidus]GHH51100.1 hypothetical protein GCM10018773_49080 [Streptomyces candidus]